MRKYESDLSLKSLSNESRSRYFILLILIEILTNLGRVIVQKKAKNDSILINSVSTIRYNLKSMEIDCLACLRFVR